MSKKKAQDQYWAARQRLRFIETCAWWKGVVNRNDVVDYFGISMAQASSDMQAYLDLNPECVIYNLRLKRYETTPGMKWMLARPNLADAVTLFLGGEYNALCAGIAGDPQAESAAVFLPPSGKVDEHVERRAFLAIMNGYRIRIRYICPEFGDEEWRRIRPHAIAFNGHNWHLRAWCERSDDYLDFPLNRIMEIEWARELMGLPRSDVEWDTWITLKVRPRRDLDALRKRAAEIDYGIPKSGLKLKVRKAMEPFVRERLGLPQEDGTKAAAPNPLLEVF